MTNQGFPSRASAPACWPPASIGKRRRRLPKASPSAAARWSRPGAAASRRPATCRRAAAPRPTFSSSKLFERLGNRRMDGVFEGELAEAWKPAADFKSYTIKIRKGVKFHDGKDMTADDVVYSIDEIWKKYAAAVGADRLRRHRGAGCRHRRRQVQQAGARVLLLLAAVRQRELHRAQARLCRQRSGHQPGQQRADRHRPVEVQGVGARQPLRVRQERRLLAQGHALHGPADHPLRARSGRPRRRHGGGRHPDRRVQSRGAARHQAADRDRQVRRHAQGLRGKRVVDHARMQHAQSALRQARGAPGDVPRRRPQLHRQDGVLRLCPAGHGPDLLAQHGVLHAPTPTRPTSIPRRPRRCSTPRAIRRSPTASASP